MGLLQSLRSAVPGFILLTLGIVLALILLILVTGPDPQWLYSYIQGAVLPLALLMLAALFVVARMLPGRLVMRALLAGLIGVAILQAMKLPDTNKRHTHPIELRSGKSFPEIIDTYRIRTSGLGLRHVLLMADFLPGETRISRVHLLAPLEGRPPRIAGMIARMSETTLPATPHASEPVRLSATQETALRDRLRVISGGDSNRIHISEDLIDDSLSPGPVEACLIASETAIFIVSEHDPDCTRHLAGRVQ